MLFERVFGFKESREAIYENIILHGEYLTSKANNKTYKYGKLEIVPLNRIRQRIERCKPKGRISVKEVKSDIMELHKNIKNKDALFQVASQFNLLEMADPTMTPEDGISIYSLDPTQGPVCAISCYAGTLYRNYFVFINGDIGQTKTRQVNCLDDVEKYLNNKDENLWYVVNGYLFPTSESALEKINSIVSNLDEDRYEYLKGLVKVGVQWDSEVVIAKEKHVVNQIYCSALPVSYFSFEKELWEKFARLILEAEYEATLGVAVENYIRTGNNRVYLTFLGGGAFGNEMEWIEDAISKAIDKFSDTPLELVFVRKR